MESFDICVLSPFSLSYCIDNLSTDQSCIYFRSLMLVAAAYHIKLGIFSDSDLYITDGKCAGRALFWNGDRFEIAEAYVPDYIENYYPPYSLKKSGPDVFPYLQSKKLLNGISLDKEKLQYALIQNGLGQYAIPTSRLNEFEDIVRAMSIYSSCVVKPVQSNQGRNIYFIEKCEDKLFYSGKEKNGELTPDTYSEICPGQNHRFIIQPRLNFQNKLGQAYDFRLLVSRGRTGDWEPVSIYSRIGSTQYVSNVSAGGSMSYPEQTLYEIVGDQTEKYVDELRQLAVRIPKMLDRYSTGLVSNYGIDVGLDYNSRQLYVIEANVGPGCRFVYWSYAEKRTQYYRYLLGRPDKADLLPM